MKIMIHNDQDTNMYFSKPSYSLREAVEDDQETLRTWKNAHSQRFFYREKISPAQQRQWFTNYLTRAEDHLFMVLVETLPIGCIGIRLLDDHWNIYNVIRGVNKPRSRGCMGAALHQVVEFALQRKTVPVRLKVLANNPAHDWYKENLFSVIETGQDHVIMQYQTL
ncbi:GNAT family N-acetyltransferase [bacterium]|nr:GNAT family N-acetyltransferase [bacterium]